MSIILFDPISKKHSHAYFNAFFIKLFSNLFQDEKITVILDESQFKQKIIKEQIPKISMKKLKNKGILRKNISLFRTIISTKPKIILFLASDNTITPIFIYFISLFFPKIKLITILHNNYNTIKNSYIKKFIWKLTLKNSKGIFLSKYIWEKAKKFNIKNIFYIQHPVYNDIIDIKTENIKKYDFLFIGRHSKYINTNKFTKIFLSTCEKQNKKIFIAIGNNCKFDFKKYKNIIVYKYNFPINDKIYWKLLNDSKYVVIPYESSFRMTASGVHIDSITAMTPTLAPHNKIFKENTINQKLLYDLNNLDKKINNLINISNEEYNKMKQEVIKIQKSLMIKSIAKDFLNILRKEIK